MLNKNQLLRRLLALACLLLLCGGLAAGQLVQLQLVSGESYVKKAALNLTTTSTVSAARGEILDRYGRPMVTNKTAFSLVLIYSAWQQEGQFERLLDLAHRVQADGGELCDTLPVSAAAPYAYVGTDADGALTTLSAYIKDSAETLRLTRVQEAVAAARAKQQESPRLDENGDTIDEVKTLDATALVTASEFIGAMQRYLVEKKSMPAGLGDADARTLIGLYYSMRQVNFSARINFTMATGVSIDLIAAVKERHQEYQGVDFETEAVRQYDTTYGAHLLGTVGPMWATEWTGTDNGGPYNKKAGYKIGDTIGKSGLEAALEEYLHGTSGARSVETGLGGETVSSQTGSYAPEPGNNVVTTIDLDLQKAAEDSLVENVSQFGQGGAAVALDVNSGEVLAMASYPAYDLATFDKDVAAYNLLAEDPRHVFNNRATSGQYAPGSTFKVLSAIAALEEGLIDENTAFYCDGKFEYGGQTFKCNNHDQPATLTLTEAIKYSCNVYFFNVGKLLTGAHLEQWCDKFGLGKVTGIEIGDASGTAAGPTERAERIEAGVVSREWQGGDDVQAAIGQSDNAFTPLQLCNYIAAVVNGGTLYRPTLVKNIKSYDYSKVVSTVQPETLGTIDISDKTLRAVKQGMGEVTAEGGTAATTFANYPIKVGGKTGTAETNNPDQSNGVFIAFAPFDDPEIAVCVVGEAAQHGSAVAPVVRDMFDAYFKAEEAGEVETAPAENTLVA